MAGVPIIVYATSHFGDRFYAENLGGVTKKLPGLDLNQD